MQRNSLDYLAGLPVTSSQAEILKKIALSLSKPNANSFKHHPQKKPLDEKTFAASDLEKKYQIKRYQDRLTVLRQIMPGVNSHLMSDVELAANYLERIEYLCDIIKKDEKFRQTIAQLDNNQTTIKLVMEVLAYLEVPGGKFFAIPFIKLVENINLLETVIKYVDELGENKYKNEKMFVLRGQINHLTNNINKSLLKDASFLFNPTQRLPQEDQLAPPYWQLSEESPSDMQQNNTYEPQNFLRK